MMGLHGLAAQNTPKPSGLKDRDKRQLQPVTSPQERRQRDRQWRYKPNFLVDSTISPRYGRSDKLELIVSMALAPNLYVWNMLF